jgi:tetratricopeptide (TPR) repeat protein
MSLAVEQVARSNHSNALQISQQAPQLLAKAPPSSSNFPLSLLHAPETSESWASHERLFYACLQAGDDKSAFLLLERLTKRFGANNERVMGMRGLYQEAVAENEEDLRKVLQEYNKILSESMNVAIHKRRIALFRSLKQYDEAIGLLVDFLEIYPTDAEAWCELADLYESQGLSSQAMFSLEEALINMPFAWNIHARLGEVAYLAARSNDGSAASQQLLTDAIQRFSRSIELCDEYLRGYYGLYLASSKFLESSASTNKKQEGDPISREIVTKLRDMAVTKLKHLVQKRAGQPEAEVIAAQALIDTVAS